MGIPYPRSDISECSLRRRSLRHESCLLGESNRVLVAILQDEESRQSFRDFGRTRGVRSKTSTRSQTEQLRALASRMSIPIVGVVTPRSNLLMN